MTSYRMQSPRRVSGPSRAEGGLLRRQVSPRIVIVVLAVLGLLAYGGFAMVCSHSKQSRQQGVAQRYQERIQQGYAPEGDD